MIIFYESRGSGAQAAIFLFSAKSEALRSSNNGLVY